MLKNIGKEKPNETKPISPHYRCRGYDIGTCAVDFLRRKNHTGNSDLNRCRASAFAIVIITSYTPEQKQGG